MRQSVLDFPLVSDGVVGVEDDAPPLALAMLVVAPVLGAVLEQIEPLAVFEAVLEVALVSALLLDKSACVGGSLPLPWNWLLLLKYPSYSYSCPSAYHFSTPCSFDPPS